MGSILTTESGTFEEALAELKRNGYTFNFVKKNEFLYCSEKEMNFKTYELTITEKYRYENKNEPSSNSVLYAVESPEYGLKGYLVN
ncbi:hypothetical protein BH11BAC4_BH11BAC4_10280 [soil metagenome]